ncbi:MAG: TolC family protein [Phycisphaera sp.]|nr:MAG: TolC family protein [Phycisphaera sp.]
MAVRLALCVAGITLVGIVGGCSSPFDATGDLPQSYARPEPNSPELRPYSVFRQDARTADSAPRTLSSDAAPDDYIRYALYHSPEAEAAFQRWRAASERLPQVSALPDPRLAFGYYIEEVQTRTGPQEARIGVEQTLPWLGTLQDREDAAAKAAMAAWREFEAVRLTVAERVVTTLHDLAYLDSTIAITRENLELLQSFEEVLRARYRVGSGSHPELVRVQVELGQVEDRVTQLEAMRLPYVAELNAALNRPMDTDVPRAVRIEGRVASVDAAQLSEIARRRNPALLALDEEIEQQRYLGAAARKDGLPDLTVGLDYVFTGDAVNPTTPGSGDDPILLRFGINVPLWREKYDAGVREATARRLAVAHERADRANRLAAGIQRAWFEHTDANRRVGLYENTLIPKAEESLRASLAGFRAGDASFLDLLDTERTLLEFAVAAQRARADRGKALARLKTLVGEPIPTKPTENVTTPSDDNEVEQ